MGNEQSNERVRPEVQIPQAQVQYLLQTQRQQYERKLEEMAAKAEAQRRQEEADKRREEIEKAATLRKQQEAARAAELRKQKEEIDAAALRKQQEEAAAAAFRIDRDRTPYSYSGNQLQQGAAPVLLYPNLNLGPGSPNTQFMSNPFKYLSPSQNQAFQYADNFYNRPGPAPSAPSAPTPPRGATPRPRSVSRPRNTPRERDVLDCPTCHARFGMRIFQCDGGHSACDDCKNRGRACGLCRMTLTNRRNYDLENHVAQTKAPCPHTSEGCKLFIKIADMEKHIKECPFKEQNCPLTDVFGTCHWKGKLSELSSHFDNMHPNGRQTNVDTEMQLTNVRNNSQQVHLIVLGVYNFLLHVKVSETDGKVYMAVQLIGTKFSAQKWLYEIHIFNKSENRRKYMYTDSCCSSSDKIEDVFKTGECAVLPVWHANTFVCNGSLCYKFFIKKSTEEKKVFVKNHRGRGRNH